VRGGERIFRVLWTRAADQASGMADALRAQGAEPVLVPTIEIRPLHDDAALERGIVQARSADWIVFTSARAAEIVLPRMVAAGLEHWPQIAVVGAATARAVRQPVLMPKGAVGTAEALADELSPMVAGKRVVQFRALEGSDVLPERLRASGAEVTVVPAYRTVMPTGTADHLRAVFEAGVDAVTFTSSSSATNLANALREAGLEMPAGVVKASIGPVTTATLRQLGWEPQVEASTTRVETLAEETALYLRSKFAL
jgi:uroporphyrinogen-III synthase